jgi:hypothetical protein
VRCGRAHCAPQMAQGGVTWRTIMQMKMLAAAATLVTMSASPALTQTPGQQTPGGQRAPDQTFGQSGTGPGQPVLNDIQTEGRRHSDNPANDVYLNQRYIGSDPDPYIRWELRRDVSPTE